MASHRHDDFDALLEKSSLGGSAGRRLRERTPPGQARTVHHVIELRTAHRGGRPGEVALPIEFEAFYLGHQEFFHHFAELHLRSRPAAEEVVHKAFLEILAAWHELLQEDNLAQQALEVLNRCVARRLEEGDAIPSGLQAIRTRLEVAPSTTGLYEAILELPSRQFTVIALHYLVGYPIEQIARYMGMDRRTVEYHVGKAKENLHTQLRQRRDKTENRAEQ
ncbi:sigma-70 family RNA polymerase sigma factor [Streptomyces sp. NPDC054887]